MRWLEIVLFQALGALARRLLDVLLGPPSPRAAPSSVPEAPQEPARRLRRWLRLPLVLVPALALAGGSFYVAVAAPVLLNAQPNPAPQQPIPFDHSMHVQVAGLDCSFCHRTAATDMTAGYPDLQQCMSCHVSLDTDDPGVAQVRQAWTQQQPVDWTNVYAMPDDVRFTHDAHIQAGIPCSTCHGDVADSHQMAQGQPLKMQQCVACHEQMKAPTTCSTCHY